MQPYLKCCTKETLSESISLKVTVKAGGGLPECDHHEKSGKKMPGFFLAIKLAVFLEIDMNSFLKDLMEASGTQITASKRQKSLVHTDAAKESGDTEVTGHVQV